jgi:hypothetical protein
MVSSSINELDLKTPMISNIAIKPAFTSSRVNCPSLSKSNKSNANSNRSLGGIFLNISVEFKNSS